jgi:hypothetical protein
MCCWGAIFRRFAAGCKTTLLFALCGFSKPTKRLQHQSETEDPNVHTWPLTIRVQPSANGSMANQFRINTAYWLRLVTWTGNFESDRLIASTIQLQSFSIVAQDGVFVVEVLNAEALVRALIPRRRVGWAKPFWRLVGEQSRRANLKRAAPLQ